jgi:hypothetical protein
MIKTTLANLLTTKLAVAAAATAAVTVGGVAAVAATGHSSGSAGESSTHASAPAGAAHSQAGEASEAANGRPSTAGDDHDPAGSPTPSLTGLCHAYEAGAGSEHGKALESPAFKYLITTAGGNDKVDAYCTTLLADGKATPATTPAAKDHSSRDAHPTPEPNTHASNAPASRPSH